jgi:hypothetical protein
MFVTTLLLLLLRVDADARTIVHAGHLIDGVSKSPRAEVSIIVDQGRIVEVVPGFTTAGAGDEIIDLKPPDRAARVDGHAHAPRLSTVTHVVHGRVRDEPHRRRHPRHPLRAYATLMAGFTTVRDLGDDA